MNASSGLMFSFSSRTPLLILHQKTFWLVQRPLRFCPISTCEDFLCFLIDSSHWENTLIRFWTAVLSSSQELADVFEPNTWLIDKKNKCRAMNPKAPVKSAEIRGGIESTLWCWQESSILFCLGNWFSNCRCWWTVLALLAQSQSWLPHPMSWFDLELPPLLWSVLRHQKLLNTFHPSCACLGECSGDMGESEPSKIKQGGPFSNFFFLIHDLDDDLWML